LSFFTTRIGSSAFEEALTNYAKINYTRSRFALTFWNFRYGFTRMFPDLGLQMSLLAGGRISKGQTLGVVIRYFGGKAWIYGVWLQFEVFRKVTQG
jgi:hypothetical protein